MILPPSIAPTINVTYIEPAKLPAFLDSYEGQILSVLQYGKKHDFPIHLDFPTPLIDLPQLNDTPLLEVWASQVKVDYLRRGGNMFSYNDQFLFGFLSIPEGGGTSLEDLSYSAYKTLFKNAFELGHAHLLRIWNYFPGINEEQRGLERYKQFCIGRHEAFSEIYKNPKLVMPAGTAIGTSSGPLTIIFLSSKRMGKNIENPRQTSAYDYPSLYGPRSPSFSRATLYDWDHEPQLFLAGTASIIGHASQHPDDYAKQTQETVRNVHAVVQRVEQEESLCQQCRKHEGILKVYIRNPHQFEEIKAQLSEHLYGNYDIVFLKGDMCRSELLLEIEGLFTYPPLSTE